MLTLMEDKIQEIEFDPIEDDYLTQSTSTVQIS